MIDYTTCRPRSRGGGDADEGMGGSIDVQAVFGDPIAPDEALPSPSLDVD